MPGTLVTGFGPFGKITENPSAKLAESSGRDCRILPVSYAAVTEFIQKLNPESFDRLLMIGVHGRARKMRMELYGRNQRGVHPDVEGLRPESGPIDPLAPRLYKGDLWREIATPIGCCHARDAGGYLCNYIYFSALRRFSSKPVGFLHIPPFSTMAFESQQAILLDLITQVEERGAQTASD